MEILLSLVTTILMAYQVTVMPATQNAKYTFSVAADDRIIRMNTQDGTMVYCATALSCDEPVNTKPTLDAE
jgi:hypothetical protein